MPEKLGDDTEFVLLTVQFAMEGFVNVFSHALSVDQIKPFPRRAESDVLT